MEIIFLVPGCIASWNWEKWSNFKLLDLGISLVSERFVLVWLVRFVGVARKRQLIITGMDWEVKMGICFIYCIGTPPSVSVEKSLIVTSGWVTALDNPFPALSSNMADRVWLDWFHILAGANSQEPQRKTSHDQPVCSGLLVWLNLLFFI